MKHMQHRSREIFKDCVCVWARAHASILWKEMETGIPKIKDYGKERGICLNALLASKWASRPN